MIATTTSTRSGNYFAGLACTFGYIIIASSQSVALNTWLASANVFLVVAVGFLVVTLCFTIVGISSKLRRQGYRLALARPGLIVALNVTSVANWLFYFLAVKYLHPAVAVTLTQGVGPVSMTAYHLLSRQTVSRVTLACHSAIFMLATIMCGYVLVNRYAPDSYGRGEILAGMVIGVLCSISLTATLTLSKRFAEDAVPASVMLSLRFYLLVIVCGVALPTQRTLNVDASTIWIAVAVGLIGIATATYLLQRGVELAPKLAVSTCLALSPLVVYLIESIRTSQNINAIVLALIGGIVAVSLISIVYDGRSGKALTKVYHSNLRAPRTGLRRNHASRH